MSRRHVVFAGLLLALSAPLGGGCGDDDPPGSPAGGASVGGGAKIEEVPALLAKALCDQQKACFGVALDVLFLRGVDCVDNFTKVIEDGDIGASKRLVAEGKLTYDPLKAQACVDAFAALTCQTLTNPAPVACAEAFGGKATAGAPCTVGAECAADHFCKAASVCPGVCTPKVPAGGACEQTEDCTAGLACADRTCAKQVGEGAACDAKRECEPGLLCIADTPADGAPRSCKRASDRFTAAVGSPCELQTAALCVPSAACELQSITAAGAVFACAPKYASGAPCKYALPDGCPDDEYCPTDFTATPPVLEATCTKRPAAGAPCGKAGQAAAECAPGDFCEDKVCVTKGRLGAACKNANGCYSGVCKAQVCAEGLACEG